METLARTGSELHVLRNWQECGRDATAPDTWIWNWARAPCGTISYVFRGGRANRGDPVPYLQSSLDVVDARLVLNTLTSLHRTLRSFPTPVSYSNPIAQVLVNAVSVHVDFKFPHD